MLNSHRIAMICVMIALLFTLTGCEDTETLRRGAHLDNTGNYRDAIDYYKSFLEEHPDSNRRPAVEEAIASAYFKWAENEKQLRNWESGVELMQIILDDYHGTRAANQVETALPEFLLEWASQMTNEGDFLEALNALTRLIRHFPASGFAEQGRKLRSEIGLFAFTSDENVYVVNADGTRLRKVASNAISPAISPEGDRISFIEIPRSEQRQGYLSVANIDGRRAERLSDRPTATDPVFTPDGTLIWFSRDDSFQAINLAGTSIHAHFGIRDFDTIGSFNPAGTEMVTYLAKPRRNISRLCITSTFEEYLELLTTEDNPIRGAAWSRDNLRIVFVTPRGVHSISPQGGEVTDLLLSENFDDIDIRDVDISPTGTNIVFIGKKPDEAHQKIYYMNLAREVFELPYQAPEGMEKPYPTGDTISWGQGFLRY
jgi:tetratricopeptide (TPR) repeat protein